MSGRPKLPVLQTIFAAYIFLFRNWRGALRIGWFPAGAVVVLDLLREALPSGDGWPTTALVLYGFIVWAAYAPFAAMVAVPWHRYVLLNNRTRGGILAIALTVREGHYAILSIAIMAIVTGMNWAAWILSYSHDWFSGDEMILVATRVALYLIAFVATYYVSAVLCLALPEVAVDRGSGYKGAFKLGYRNGWRLVIVILGVVAPYYSYYYGIGYLPDSALEGVWELAWAIADGVIFVLVAFLAAAALSLSYRALGGLRGSPPEASVIPASGDT